MVFIIKGKDFSITRYNQQPVQMTYSFQRDMSGRSSNHLRELDFTNPRSSLGRLALWLKRCPFFTAFTACYSLIDIPSV